MKVESGQLIILEVRLPDLSDGQYWGKLQCLSPNGSLSGMIGHTPVLHRSGQVENVLMTPPERPLGLYDIHYSYLDILGSGMFVFFGKDDIRLVGVCKTELKAVWNLLHV